MGIMVGVAVMARDCRGTEGQTDGDTNALIPGERETDLLLKAQRHRGQLTR